jgi:thioredoxin 1
MTRLTARSLTSALAPAAFVLAAGVAAHAGPIQPFTTQAFKAAQSSGRPILVDAHADWCPTCRAQAPTISALSRNPAFARLTILKLDYDKQVDEKRALNIRHQSTLIAFVGSRETGRSTGVTDPAQIQALAGATLR